MLSVKEQYWRYSLVALILGLGVMICFKLTPVVGGILGAATIYVLLRKQMNYLTTRCRWWRSMAATLLLFETILCFLVPLSLVIWMIGSQIQNLEVQSEMIKDTLRSISTWIGERLHYDISQDENISSVVAMIPKMGQWVLRGILDFAVNIIVLLFVLYFMLIGGPRMERYFRELLPFNESIGRSLVREVHAMVRSNAIGIPLLAIVQGGIAYIGYLLIGVPLPLFWAILTCFATVIPVVGSMLVWIPLGAYMALTGDWTRAIILFIYGGIIISNVDNVIRLVLQKHMAGTHPLITLFGVVIGLPLFGFMGVIFGPLLLNMFVFFVDLFKKKFLDKMPDSDLFDSPCKIAPDHAKIRNRRFFGKK